MPEDKKTNKGEKEELTNLKNSDLLIVI